MAVSGIQNVRPLRMSVGKGARLKGGDNGIGHCTTEAGQGCGA